MEFCCKNIIEQCESFISFLRTTNKGCFLVRNLNINIETCSINTHNLLSRKPKDTDPETHLKVNEYYFARLGWSVRNGVFCYGVSDSFDSLDHPYYGLPYLLFPVGNFEAVYAPGIYDFTVAFSMRGNISEDQFIRELNYTSTNIEKAMTVVLERFRSAEIIVRCEQYFLLNLKYREELIKMIWSDNHEK